VKILNYGIQHNWKNRGGDVLCPTADCQPRIIGMVDYLLIMTIRRENYAGYFVIDVIRLLAITKNAKP
jgi:hypothetical protein